MEFPAGFLEKYEGILGEEFPAFKASFDQPAESAYRVNPLKAKTADFPDAIPNSRLGHYGKVSGKSIAHATGLVYSQEPAAQAVAELAAPRPGMRVLDLCAAPGGKSTHLLSFMENEGLLISNEISGKRSKILVENIERFGAKNTVVLNESPERLSKVFPDYFDLIVIDAPCSGEGMFRKDPDAMQYWTPDYPLECSILQKEILEEAMKMLAPAGSLVYSTCTWAPEEDELMTSWLLEQYPSLEKTAETKCWPHLQRGEGQYLARLKDRREKDDRPKLKAAKSNWNKGQKELWQAFEKEALTVQLHGVYQVFGDQLYLLPEATPDLGRLRIARNGLHLGTFKKNRFEPSFALGLALRPDEVKQHVSLNESDFARYVAGEALPGQEATVKGWVQVLSEGNGLGFAKVANQTLKNYYPKGLRFYI
ncbi:RsmF rRNA methyltransferase first C-terminal domain-containing protein [Lactococcus termiticola]|uniref:23S rRNA methyltransferase n=1 Tax=Lactococcus termiticola TaxID=2169526 RepID=A0A2R5HJB5_9LACT|nr:RsmB/NOP family class I SAM-dependent RNA methyltransferase [Lactococcus termiticola]GBG96640.1 23S rRNA methyltransferase [Lactococcus termiticola]